MRKHWKRRSLELDAAVSTRQLRRRSAARDLGVQGTHGGGTWKVFLGWMRKGIARARWPPMEDILSEYREVMATDTPERRRLIAEGHAKTIAWQRLGKQRAHGGRGPRKRLRLMDIAGAANACVPTTCGIDRLAVVHKDMQCRNLREKLALNAERRNRQQLLERWSQEVTAASLEGGRSIFPSSTTGLRAQAVGSSFPCSVFRWDCPVRSLSEKVLPALPASARRLLEQEWKSGHRLYKHSQQRTFEVKRCPSLSRDAGIVLVGKQYASRRLFVQSLTKTLKALFVPKSEARAFLDDAKVVLHLRRGHDEQALWYHASFLNYGSWAMTLSRFVDDASVARQDLARPGHALMCVDPPEIKNAWQSLHALDFGSSWSCEIFLMQSRERAVGADFTPAAISVRRFIEPFEFWRPIEPAAPGPPGVLEDGAAEGGGAAEDDGHEDDDPWAEGESGHGDDMGAAIMPHVDFLLAVAEEEMPMFPVAAAPEPPIAVPPEPGAPASPEPGAPASPVPPPPPPPEPPAPLAGPPLPPEPPVAKAKAAAKGKAKAAKGDRAWDWGHFKMARVYSDDVQIGFGCACGKHTMMPGHKPKTPCKKQMTFGKEGFSEDFCIRKLKAWAVRGLSIPFNEMLARAQHVDPDIRNDIDPGTHEQLERELEAALQKLKDDGVDLPA
ncbi:unnamed protein product [Prorocentrum cordatum]|uniref:Uncharacterized protein n=1 Tax=Prorocentrum cordatum TaxID=2364126 RepID=A0ABN9TYH8_9DINO|nr:unnamed protein product [Polarella glacialis]